ncbi:hypothetical protein [Aquipuribacter nitratireducens]|uniref:Uncharacterized protein n=1 Tax=Aquipuribacter nitratireducens TaxID=650104 RepID=A0ABW0GN81_9MICO
MPGPADLGFAEFVSTLLSETTASVIAAHTEQEERLRDLAASATMSPEEYALLLPAEEVDAALASLLPGEQGGTSAVPGGPVPPKDVLAGLELDLDDSHVEGRTLTEAGAAAVRRAVAEHLAERHLSGLREAARTGLPRVVVDGGTVSAKLTYSVVDPGEKPEEPGRASGLTRPGDGSATKTSLDPRLAVLARVRPDLVARVPSALSGVRLAVRPASPDMVQDATVRADVFGEVRVTFRTVL